MPCEQVLAEECGAVEDPSALNCWCWLKAGQRNGRCMYWEHDPTVLRLFVTISYGLQDVAPVCQVVGAPFSATDHKHQCFADCNNVDNDSTVPGKCATLSCEDLCMGQVSGAIPSFLMRATYALWMPRMCDHMSQSPGHRSSCIVLKLGLNWNTQVSFWNQKIRPLIFF